ncbi:hypothetical protein POVWA2_024180 [Plasmodium ovale wallikeri]|uniref:Uncharacterized protein n=1 Tax=Plasmodium ovale wallikeri TaxID=864142 RepID=A0A1A8YTS2_PLAOA|nr:hypothetical protein POVWA1_024300 [Plasmodium ovale wallikeri]SBT35260.1 hypothetical protein POVWA2_024180 [Plasmodium ovale wallikeri]
MGHAYGNNAEEALSTPCCPPCVSEHDQILPCHFYMLQLDAGYLSQFLRNEKMLVMGRGIYRSVLGDLKWLYDNECRENRFITKPYKQGTSVDVGEQL